MMKKQLKRQRRRRGRERLEILWTACGTLGANELGKAQAKATGSKNV